VFILQTSEENIKNHSQCYIVFGRRGKLDGGIWMNISARNTLKGKVKNITPGAVNTEVIIELPNGLEVVSIITKDSADRLNLTAGKEVYAV